MSPRARSIGVLIAVMGVAAAVRAVLSTDSLAGDEVFSLWVVDGRSPGDIVDLVRSPQPGSPEASPPLFFLLARGALALVSEPEAMRIVSVVASVLTVPVLWALGRRVFSENAGLLAAVLWALLPFAVYYGVDARPYGLLAFLCAASTLALVVAHERRDWRWWVLYAGLALAVPYTHYTGLAVVAAQAAWLVLARPEPRRMWIGALAAVGLLFLPWIPALRAGSISDTLAIYELLGPGSFGDHVTTLAQVFPGHPFVPVEDLPGTPVVVIGCLVLALALADAARGGWARLRARPLLAQLATPAGLLVLTAAATPAGLLVISIARGQSILLPRSMSASLPMLLLLLAAGVLAARRPLAVAATASSLVMALIGLVLSFDPDNRRPDFRGLAETIDAEARPGEPVIVFSFVPPEGGGSRFVSLNFERSHPQRFLGFDDRPAWREAARTGKRVFLVLPNEATARPRIQLPPEARGFQRAESRFARGYLPFELLVLDPPR